MKYIKIPYGMANFESLVSNNYHYVDRTQYIEIIEEMGDRNLAFLRPRRFGKSLFVNVLKDYYDIRKKAKFEALFGKYYIGKNPTPLANSYMILSFDFSGITTDDDKSAHYSFLAAIKIYVGQFLFFYFPTEYKEMEAQIKELKDAHEVMKSLFAFVARTGCAEKIYLTIDEYDHFANELIAWNLDVFREVVSKNGWVRKFYETLKIAVGDGIVDRIFITGVSPITLDSLTSGFNIVKQLSSSHILHELMGFTKEEVAEIMLGVGAKVEALPQIMSDLKDWYNGYLFCEEATNRLYNPDMVLYFASEYRNYQKYPRRMLDVNVMSDYSKIRRLFKIGGQEEERISILEELLQNGQIMMKMTDQFSFEKRFDNKDFINLLYYTGAITIKETYVEKTVFNIPNYVIKQLYFEYFSAILMDRINSNHDVLKYNEAIDELVSQNNIKPLVKVVSTILSRLSNRDNMNFGEKHLKTIFVTILMFSEAYYVHSELELHKKYTDLFIERTSRFNIPYQYLIEFKYFSKAKYEEMIKPPKEGGETEWEKVIEDGRNQLRGYTKQAYFQAKKDLKPWLIAFVGENDLIVEEI